MTDEMMALRGLMAKSADADLLREMIGFWRALDEVFPGTAHQRCWVHKAAHVRDEVPKSVQPAMKADLREIHGAPTRAAAEAALVVFVEKHGANLASAEGRKPVAGGRGGRHRPRRDRGRPRAQATAPPDRLRHLKSCIAPAGA